MDRGTDDSGRIVGNPYLIALCQSCPLIRSRDGDTPERVPESGHAAVVALLGEQRMEDLPV